jgi:serine/threonine-protein kinase
MPPFEFLGPYRIGKPLGKGGMGSVFAAVHEKTGEKVAVKLIAAHVADEARFRRRFDDEVKTLQQLRHKNIVRLIGFGEEEGQLFYSMELVEGETLQARIRREKKISWLPALNIAIEICAALKHAHDFGVIHRDLKPANLLLGSDNGVKLVDFGIAKIFGEGEQTLAGSVLGTADYMAPEQATGSGVTVRTDLYALGSVMYAMLTGRPPFRGKSVTEVIESLKRDRPVPLEMVDPYLPEEVVELVHQLLEKDPEARPPTALSVMNRLKAMRAGLQRDETVVGNRSATKVGIQKSKVSPSKDSLGPIDPDSATDDSDSKSSHRKRTVVTKGGADPVRNVDPDGATVVSGVDSRQTENPEESAADLAEQAQSETRTHFQTVSESERRPGFFQSQESDNESVWVNHLAIAGMITVLLIAAGLFLYAMRAPSADQLYAAVVDQQDTRAMKSFIKLFPEDPRFSEVLNLHMNSRLDGQIRRLQTQQKLGVTPLDAYEESFLAAIDGRFQQPVEAIERLDQWLVVYNSPESELDDSLSTLIELARHEREQLRDRAPAIIIDPRAQEMITKIRSLANEHDTEFARAKLNGIVETFQTIDWAKPAVEDAKRQLQALEEFSEQN